MDKNVYIVEVPFVDIESADTFENLLQCIANDNEPTDLRAIIGYIALNSVLQYTVRKDEEN